MAASLEEWSISSNEATRISLVCPRANSSGLETIHSFHPPFTYPIFGFDEVIFGYKNLKINVDFASHDCRPHVSVSYDHKFPSQGDAKALNINKTLKKFLPASAFDTDFEKKLEQDDGAQSWTPPGELVHQYSRGQRQFEVWAGSLADGRVRGLLDNIQILILFFIEGGQMLPLDELEWALRRWRVYYVFEKRDAPNARNISPYSLCGYATTWRFFKFTSPKSKPTTTVLDSFPDVETVDLLQLPCRLRISQFLLLPTYQSSGHGSELYKLIYREVMADSSIVELTVEDPSEEFDKLRDSNDWKVLEPEFRNANISINTEAFVNQNRISRVPYKTLLPVDTLNSIRTSKKIAPRQFARLTELYLYSCIPQSHRDPVGSTGSGAAKLMIQKHKTAHPDDRTYYWWRILIRSRIFRKNKEVLMSEFELDDRRKHLQDTSRGQQDEYENLLIHMLTKAIKESSDNAERRSISDVPRKRKNSEAETLTALPRKRKNIVEDDDDEDEGATAESSSSSKHLEA